MTKENAVILSLLCLAGYLIHYFDGRKDTSFLFLGEGNTSS